jgi:transcriptional regulator of acetoin/glycerol metabolism
MHSPVTVQPAKTFFKPVVRKWRNQFARIGEQASADHIRAALQRAGGVKNEAAQLLGIERTTLYRWLKKNG